MNNPRLSAFCEVYVRETRGFIFLTDEAVSMVLWVFGVVGVFGLLSTIGASAATYQSQRAGSDVVDSLKARLSYFMANGYARLTPALDATGATNCAAGWCREIDFHVREADNVDRYVGFDFTGAAVQEVKFTALTGAGGRIGLGNVGNALTMSGFQVHDMLAPTLSTDGINPYGALAAALWTAAGSTPQDVSVNYGSTGTIGHNDVVFVKMWNKSTGDDIAFAPVTLVTKDLTIGVGWYLPTPPPSMAVGGLNGPGDILYHWPADPSGPTSFSVSETDYHDAFFAEDGTCNGIAVPSPNYVNGSSPAYLPSSMWGDAGPWVYPNPNPTAPPGQPSGPGTFGFQAQNPGLCTMGLYDVNANRGAAAEITFGVQIMGPIGTNPTGLFFPTPTSPAQSETSSKTYDAENLQPTFGGNCAGIASEAVAAYDTQGTPSSTPTSTVWNVSPVAGGVCAIALGDQYGEPTNNVNVTVAGALQVLNDSTQSAIGSIEIPVNGSGGWATVTLDGAKSYLPVGLSDSIGIGSCGGLVSIGGPGGDDNVGVMAEQPFTLTGLAPTSSCTISVTDQYGETVSVQVVVDTQPVCPPGYTGTPPNCVFTILPTPTPAPVPVALYASFWSAQFCSDPFCDSQYGVELSDGYMLMSDGSVIGTLGGPLPYQADCGTTLYYSSTATTPGGAKPYDPGIWSGNGVTEDGVTDMWQNVFNVESIPGSTQVIPQTVGATYDYFADVNSAVGSVPDGVTEVVAGVASTADIYWLLGCAP